MKFDAVIGNPPYQDPKNKHSPLWKKFVKKSFQIAKKEGFVSLIHPCSWRKPEHKLFSIFQDNNVKYMEIHNQTDGMRVFGVGTRYDWYIAQKTNNKGKTVIVDENKEMSTLDISNSFCIPHGHLNLFTSLTANNERRCKVISDRSNYGHDKTHISKTLDGKHIYPCVNSTKTSGRVCLYSSTKDNGHFGVSKVIMGMASPENGFFDKDGTYGVTDNCFAIVVDSEEEGEIIEKILKIEKFRKLINICKWSGFAFDPTIFKYFKKDFWKEFI